MQLTKYESYVIDDIAKHIVQPNVLAKALACAGMPVEKLLGYVQNSKIRALRKVGDTVQSTIEKAIIATIKVARTIASDNKVVAKYQRKGFPIRFHSDIVSHCLDLEQRDSIADCFDFSNAAIVGARAPLWGVRPHWPKEFLELKYSFLP